MNKYLVKLSQLKDYSTTIAGGITGGIIGHRLGKVVGNKFKKKLYNKADDLTHRAYSRGKLVHLSLERVSTKLNQKGYKLGQAGKIGGTIAGITAGLVVGKKLQNVLKKKD